MKKITYKGREGYFLTEEQYRKLKEFIQTIEEKLQ